MPSLTYKLMTDIFILAPSQYDKLLSCVDEDYNGTALYWCSVHGYPDLVLRLIQIGAHVNAKNCHGHTALHAAADMNHQHVVQLILSWYASLEISVVSTGRYPLSISITVRWGGENVIMASKA